MQNKEDLIKLIDFVYELTTIEEYSWVRDSLNNKLNNTTNEIFVSKQIDEIHEHFFRKIVEFQANNFYQDFKLSEIKKTLIKDYARMEKFRRENNFEEFCFAVFQQMEAIVNHLANGTIKNMFFEDCNRVTHKAKNEDKTLGQLVFYASINHSELEKKRNLEIKDWAFMERFKLVLYYYFYNEPEKIHYYSFMSNYNLMYGLYKMRNLNHRGGLIENKKKEIIEDVKKNSHRYYFKYLGFLEEFVTKINEAIMLI